MQILGNVWTDRYEESWPANISRAVLVMGISALFLFFKYVLQVYPSVMATQFMAVFSTGGAGLGKLAAAYFYGYLITQFFVGILLDRFSIKYISAFAVFISSSSLLLFSKANSLFSAELTRFFMGSGAAFSTVTYMKLASMYFKPKHFALVGGLLATATMMGAIFGQAPLSLLVNNYGWRYSLQIISYFGFTTVILFLIFVKNKNIKRRNDPINPVSMKEMLFNVVKSKQNWLLTMYGGFTFAPVAVFAGLWGPSYIEQAYSISNTDAAVIVSTMFMGLAFGGPVVGWFSDKIGKKKPLMIFGILTSCAITMSVIYYPHFNLTFLCILMFLDGFVTGAYMLGFVIGKEINPGFVSATIVAMINSGDAVLGAITEPAIGHILDFTSGHASHFTIHNYQVALCMLPTFYIIALIIMCFIQEPQSKFEKKNHIFLG